jgi:flagellar motor switch protein FliN/FliY
MPETINTPTQNEQQDRSEPAAPVPPTRSPDAPGPRGPLRDLGPSGPGAGEDKTQVQEVQLSEAPADSGPASAGQLDILLDMGIPISVVLGQTQIPVRRLLQLGPGSVLQLDKSIEAPADLYLKDSKFAEADIVVVEDRFAVRIKKILGAGTPADS